MYILVNYADAKYNPARKWNSFTGKYIAKFDKIIECSPEKIDEEFKEKYKEIFAEKRGNGLWLWKPYFINKIIERCKDGEIIFYCDAGSFFIRSFNGIIKYITNENPIFVCDIPLLESCFTKPLCFKEMNCDEEFYKNSNQIISTYFVFMVNSFTRKFMKEWLFFCCKYELIKPEGNFKNLSHNFNNNFVVHREDQSIFSLLCKKYKVIPHKDFSQRGNSPTSYKKPFYTYREPLHINDKYKSILFLHKSPRLNIMVFIKYFWHELKRKLKEHRH